MNKPDSQGIENREQHVSQRFDQFLVGIQGQLSELKEAMARRNQVSEGVGERHIASLVDRLWSRVTNRATDAETIAKLAPSIWRQSALFFRTLSPTDIIRLADEKKWPIHLTTEQVRSAFGNIVSTNASKSPGYSCLQWCRYTR